MIKKLTGITSNFGCYRKLLLRKIRPDYLIWKKSKYAPPSPQKVKNLVLERYTNPKFVWVESGTYLGDTAKYLSGISQKVFTIEPDHKLCDFATHRLAKFENIKVVHGTSEEKLPEIISTLRGSVGLWLDGHYSGDITYLGKTVSPIIQELHIISKYMHESVNLIIFIDDHRLFVDSEKTMYPKLDQVINLLIQMEYDWTIEHDILIAWKRKHHNLTLSSKDYKN